MKRISMQQTKGYTIDDCFNRFIKYCTVKNLGSRTVKGYQFHYKVLGEFVDCEKYISALTTDTIQDFIIYLKEKHDCNDITINSYLRSIRA